MACLLRYPSNTISTAKCLCELFAVISARHKTRPVPNLTIASTFHKVCHWSIPTMSLIHDARFISQTHCPSISRFIQYLKSSSPSENFPSLRPPLIRVKKSFQTLSDRYDHCIPLHSYQILLSYHGDGSWLAKPDHGRSSDLMMLDGAMIEVAALFPPEEEILEDDESGPGPSMRSKRRKTPN